METRKKRRQQINRDHKVNSKTVKNFINRSLTGNGEKWKQPERIMVEGGNDNNRRGKENHYKLRHVLPTLHWIVTI